MSGITPPYRFFFGAQNTCSESGQALICIGRSARKWPSIRPAGFVRRSVPNPARALTCIGKGARNSLLIHPAGLARSSVSQVMLGVPSRILPSPSLVSDGALGTDL